MLQKFSTEHAKAVKMAVDTSTEDDESVDQQLYQSAIGSLLYLSIATRPEIAFAVGRVAKYSAKPTKQHWIAVKHIFRYLKGTVHYGLQYSKVEQTDCIGFSDADWA